MKRFLKSMVVAMMMVFTLSTVVFATPSNGTTSAKQVQQQLEKLGVPSKYIGNVVEYLQKVVITDAQADQIIANINKAEALIGSQKDLTKLSASTKNELYSIAEETGKILGLNVVITKGSNGARTSVVVTDSKGNKILALTTSDVEKIATNFNAQDIIKVVEAAADFSNNPDKAKFDPITGKPNKTATPYGNAMALGFGLVGLSGASLAFGRKKVAFK